MDRRSKIENLNRKYLGAGTGVTAIRSENVLGTGLPIGGITGVATTTTGGLAFGRGASTLGTIGGGVTTLGGVSGGVTTLGGGVTTIGGIGGGINRIGGVTNVARVSALSPTTAVQTYSPPAVVSPTIVRASAVRNVGASPMTVDRGALGNLISGGGQQVTVNTGALGNLIKPPSTTNIITRPVAVPTYTQVPVVSTVTAAPYTSTVVTKQVVSEPSPPAVTTVATPAPTHEVEYEPPKRKNYFAADPHLRRPGCCERFNNLCRPCCGCPWWLALLLGLLLLSLLLGALSMLLGKMNTSTTTKV